MKKDVSFVSETDLNSSKCEKKRGGRQQRGGPLLE